MSTRQHLCRAATAGALFALTTCAAPASPAPSSPAPAAVGPEQGHGGHGSESEDGPPVLYAVQSGPLGVVITDGSGRLMYRSDGDSADPSRSNCTGPCTETWLPVAAPSEAQEPELLGVDPELVGTVERSDGTAQLTLAGWPLYSHRDDGGDLESAGQHGADGAWFVVTPTGEKASAPS